MGVLKSLEQGLALLRAVAQSDAVVDARNRVLNRIAEQASRLAQSGLVPKAVAAPAELVAELIARKPANKSWSDPAPVQMPADESINVGKPPPAPVQVPPPPPASVRVDASAPASTNLDLGEPSSSNSDWTDARSSAAPSPSEPPSPRPRTQPPERAQTPPAHEELHQTCGAASPSRLPTGNKRGKEPKISVHATAGKKTRTHGSTKKQSQGSKKVRDKQGGLK